MKNKAFCYTQNLNSTVETGKVKKFGEGQALEDVGRMDYVLLIQIPGFSTAHELLLDGEYHGVWNGKEVSYFTLHLNLNM